MGLGDPCQGENAKGNQKVVKYSEFEVWRSASIERMSSDAELASLGRNWFARANSLGYSYHFEWLGRPIIQYPSDVMALQEIIWRTKPSLIVEAGIAHGGSVVFSASMLALLDVCEPPAARRPKGREVVAIDIDIRPESGGLVRDHPLASRITLLEGSSTDPEIVDRVERRADQSDRVMVILDSNHTHEHVLAELRAYGPFVSQGCYLVVMDTVIEHLPPDSFPDRPWGVGNSPMTAVEEFLIGSRDFVVDEAVTDKLAFSVAPRGYLLRISS